MKNFLRGFKSHTTCPKISREQLLKLMIRFNLIYINHLNFIFKCPPNFAGFIE